ncbi:MAG: S4 domain-containing protein, partial [Winogradskyella sp.]|nr:S4 domain-containing protein [Winogradskyella sp.]
MSRHQDSKGKGKTAGRGNANSKAKSFARGNAPLKNKSQAVKPIKSSKPSNPDEMRLNKYIANSGMCSRREADENIAIGLVSVNGKVVTEMGYKVNRGDEVKVDGQRIMPEAKAYVLLNKPKGFATTTSEGKGRTVMDLVANATSSNIKPIGRLGRNSVG